MVPLVNEENWSRYYENRVRATSLNKNECNYNIKEDRPIHYLKVDIFCVR